MIFVDTGAWFAAFVPNDAHHAAARGWIDNNSEPLLTTDYVLDELLTLLRVRGEQARAIILGEQILSESIVSLYLVSVREVQLAFDVFRKFGDKNWSFSDCVSRVVMEESGTHPTAIAWRRRTISRRQFPATLRLPI